MKQLMLLEVRGKHKKWNFTVEGDTEFLEEWRADGLDINPLWNAIPLWAVNMGLTKPWVFIQDFLNNIWVRRVLIGLIIVGIVTMIVVI